jgi:uncharacterized protein with ParB-like and HNH nuclease domain
MENESAQLKFTGGLMTLNELIDLEKNGKLVVQPKYQRDFFWGKAMQKLFIKGFCNGYHSPGFTFNITPEGVYEVIDGHQRITTLLNYIKSCPDEVLEKIREFKLGCVMYIEASYEDCHIAFCLLNGRESEAHEMIQDRVRRDTSAVKE